MNDATDVSARAQPWARVTPSCLLAVFTCPSVLRGDACCWLRHRGSRELAGEFPARLVSLLQDPAKGENVIVTTTALARARAGDGEAFRELTEPHRRELQLHCYRILGSVQDAEDTLQETLLAAWRGLGQFEERASLRSWLYKIATNRCLNALRDTGRRPAAAARYQWSAPPPEPTRQTEPLWLQPYPDALLDGLPDAAPGPEARYETKEAVALAFVAGLQRLPPRQRAVLVLRDVLGHPAAQAAARSESARVGEQRLAAGPCHARRPGSCRGPRRRSRAALSPGARAHEPVRGRVRGRRRRPPGGLLPRTRG